MTTLLQDVKIKMGFSKRGPMCSNCKHFTYEVTTKKDWAGREFSSEKNLRCGFGGFKVDKSNWCNKHEPKL